MSLDGYIAHDRGKRALPGGVRLNLELVEERRFAGGVVHLRYRTSAGVLG
jgi:hypothetical protein